MNELPGYILQSSLCHIVVQPPDLKHLRKDIRMKKKTAFRKTTLTFGMASLSALSGPSSESEKVCVSAGMRGRWSGWKLIWVLRRLLTAFRELQVLGGSEGSASRSEIRPWASPITAISTTTLVPED